VSSVEDGAKANIQQKIHMDIGSNVTHLKPSYILMRGAMFFGWMILFLLSMATIGLIPTVPIFIIAFMRLEAHEPWKIVLSYVVAMTILIYVVFDQLLTIPWPQTLVGSLFPILKNYIPSM
jgi:hypothetical protein